jgi:4-hydroxybenzoate polyprenyltransferase
MHAAHPFSFEKLHKCAGEVEKVKNALKGSFLEKNWPVLLDTLFLLSFLAAVAFLVAMVADFVFFIPATIFCVLWLALSLTVSRKQGRDIKVLIRRGKVMPSSGLPLNKRLHIVYTVALLVSFMVFFSLMIVMRELSMMLAFVSWLFVGYATLQDISQREMDEQKMEAQRTSA